MKIDSICYDQVAKNRDIFFFFSHPPFMVLLKTLECPLDCKEIHPVHSKGDLSWVFIGRTDIEPETLILGPPHVKS